MDIILGVFTKLGADISLLYQFGIILLLFLILRPLFFDKLQFVIEYREKKTTGLERESSEKLAMAQKISGEYGAILDDAHRSAQKRLNEEKERIIGESRDKLADVGKEVDQEVIRKNKEIRMELEQKKLEIIKTRKELTEQLVSKLTE